MKRTIVVSYGAFLLAVLAPLPCFGQGADAGWDNSFGALGMSTTVRALASAGSNVYVGGDFTVAGGSGASRIAIWNGASWSALGSGVSGAVNAIAVTGSGVYVGGLFTTAGGSAANRIARWSGSSWSSLGIGVSGDVHAVAASGTDVYVGGTFTTAGGMAALRIAKWNGSSWSALGSGVSGDVNAVAISGTDVYVGGTFTTAGGGAAFRIARWNGSSWSALGSGVSGTVNAITVDGGNIYVGGTFTTAGGGAAFRIARWNGSSWSALGSGVSGTVNAIAVDGSHIYVGGSFTTAGGGAALRIAVWDGSTWTNLGSGMSDAVLAIAGTGTNLHVGGPFTTAGSKQSLYFGIWDTRATPIFITNFGAERHGFAIKLWWDIFADEEIAEYKIYRREKGRGLPEVISRSNPLSPDVRTYVDASAEPGTIYEYMLGAVRPDGSEVRSPWVEVETPESVAGLEQNQPNPFNPSTAIAFMLARGGHVTLRIYDVRGQEVATLVNAALPAGPNHARWDGRDASGRPVSSGVYFYRLKTGKTELTKKMVLMK